MDIADSGVNHDVAAIQQQPDGLPQRALGDWALATRRDRERDTMRARASGTGFSGHSIARRFGRAIQHAEVEPCIDHIRHMLAEIGACDEQQRMLSFSASHKLPLSSSNPVSHLCAAYHE